MLQEPIHHACCFPITIIAGQLTVTSRRLQSTNQLVNGQPDGGASSCSCHIRGCRTVVMWDISDVRDQSVQGL